ncbi:uncharacterized protein BYT42DRAFT_503301 [Radiomyces spectabilis]|uniref:uncharacterized protein n=1 Tax=Radiomyces spectabilis TaxID=64574 RepID=UPI00221EF97D|nr:uncharacterized protein BYT42DRAFT_503301 [Radiomyces spectabilis]KAI8369569.1 hypothetical protein BYT42DRAFT_503301 [Radiomyces spectabilis]
MFPDDLVHRMAPYSPMYHRFIEQLKADGYEVIGYARKSTGHEELNARVRLL